MVDMNIVIAYNINTFLKKQNSTPQELAEHLKFQDEIMNKVLDGNHATNAGRMKKVAEFLNVSMEELTTVPQNFEETDINGVVLSIRLVLTMKECYRC